MMIIGAGIVLMRFDSYDEPRYFLLRGRDTGVWSFPKGHPEICDREQPLATALRETFEETGLVVNSDYILQSGPLRFGKRPYWIGIVNPHSLQRVQLAAREHSMGGWFTIAEIQRLKTNVDVRAWHKRATNPYSKFSAVIDGLTS